MRELGITLGLFGLSLLLTGCAPKPDRPPIGERERELVVSLRIFRAENTGDVLVAEDDLLHNGDFVYFSVRTTRPAYLYVVLSGADGAAKTLFPTAKYQLISTECALRVPADRTLNLAEPAGIENLRVVASLKPLAEVDRLLCEELKLDCKPAGKDTRPVAAPCAKATVDNQVLRGLTAVKTSRADNNGIAQTRFSLRHDR